MNFKKHLIVNFKSILKSKIYNFLEKSIWKYFILTGIIGIVKPDLFGSSLKTAFSLFIIIISLVIILMIVSSILMSNKIKFDFQVEFTDSEIIFHADNQDSEKKDWNWIKSIKENRNHFWLEVDEFPPFLINLRKEKLTTEEIEFFKSKIIS